MRRQAAHSTHAKKEPMPMSIAETKPDHTNGQPSDEAVPRSLELPPELTNEDVEKIKRLVDVLSKRNGSVRSDSREFDSGGDPSIESGRFGKECSANQP